MDEEEVKAHLMTLMANSESCEEAMQKVIKYCNDCKGK